MSRYTIGKKLFNFVFGLIAVVLLASPKFSYAVTWDFTCSNQSGCGNNNFSSLTFISGGQSLIAEAFATTNTDGTGNFQTATLGWYSHGLGVHSQGESTQSPNHAVDNNGQNEMVVFRFPNDTYISTSVFLSVFGDTSLDTDIYAFVGSGGACNNFAFTSLSYATLSANGFTAYGSPNAQLNGNTGSDRTAGLNQSNLNLSGQCLIIGANNSQSDDYFKIGALTANAITTRIQTNVPEPSSFLLLGIGLFGLRALIARRVVGEEK